MDAGQVKSLLNERVEEVAAMLLPAGKKDGVYWTCGDADNTPPSNKTSGGSLKLNLTGKYIGMWNDFATEEHGDLIALWMRRYGLTYSEAMDQIRDYLGVKDNGFRRKTIPQSSVLKTGKKELQYDLVAEGSPVWKWLCEDRKISAAALTEYRIGQLHRDGAKDVDRNGWYVVFPFFDVDGNLVRLKYRHIEDKKKMWQWPSFAKAHEYKFGSVKLLFGIQAVPDDCRDVCITEGEMDALSVFDAGFYALSLPEGSQVKKNATEDDVSKSHEAWLEHDKEYMDRFTEVLFALDCDHNGKKATEVLVPRIGRPRVRVGDFGKLKDANGVLVDAGADALGKCISGAKNMDPEDLKIPENISKEIWDLFYPEEAGKPLGEETPWTLNFRFHEGQLTIWHGFSGHGKTVCQTWVLANLALRYGCKVCIASLEWPGAYTFKNMFRQMMGLNKPSKKQFNEALSVANKHFMVYDHVGEAAIREVIDVFEYAYTKYGCKHFALDSMMMLKGLSGDDYNGQKFIVQQLKTFAMRYGVHVHLVCHSKKPDARHAEGVYWPNKHSISGSGDLSNIADNVVCVWRKMQKEEEIEASYHTLKTSTDQQERKKAEINLAFWQAQEDAMFLVQKQRLGGENPKKRLWFSSGEASSWQYREDQDSPENVDLVGRYLNQVKSSSPVEEEVF